MVKRARAQSSPRRPRRPGSDKPAPSRAGSSTREIPQRELRNDVSRVLAEVAAGARFRVTVRGQPVAEIGPVARRRVWVPWRDVVAILERGPLDDSLLRDVDEAVDQTTEDPWTRYSTPRSS